MPNLGQWRHPARFVRRAGAVTVFLEDRGWILDLSEPPVAQGTRRDLIQDRNAGTEDVTPNGEPHDGD